MDKLTYKTILQHHEFEIPKIKGSRFIGNVFHVEDKEEAEQHLREIEKRYPDASHHCYAYRYEVQMNHDIFGAAVCTSKYTKISDAGEPANTAGKPIMSMIEKHGLHNVLVIVTRFFGGTLLGVGGLIQAYGECAKQALEHARISETEITRTMRFRYAFDLVPIIRNILNRYAAKIVEEKYDKDVEMEIRINSGYLEAFKKDVFESSKGKIRV